MNREKILEAAQHLVRDLEMLKEGTWVPDKHSINASLENADLIVEQATLSEKIYCCEECGEDEISWQAWVDEHDEVTGSGTEDRYVFCENCAETTKCIEKTNYKP